MDGVYVYNNYFHGDWGNCPTGFIFVEFGGGAGGTPSNMITSAWFNNVFVVSPTTTFENTNSWFDIASGISGTQRIFDNTFIGPKATDNTLCISMQNLSSVSFENNVISNCGDPVRVDSSTMSTVNNNLYGPSCQNGNNCFVLNNSFTGSFSSWKASCNCDSASVQSNSPLLNADGSPQSGSPLIGLGANLTSLAIGNFASLSSDTSKGNTRTPVVRPGSGAWDTGAYKF